MFNKKLRMTGFEPRISGGGVNRSTNWFTTTAQQLIVMKLFMIGEFNDSYNSLVIVHVRYTKSLTDGVI